MRKTRLLTLLLLLMTAVTGAWANDYLYLEVNGSSATLKYGSDYYGNPYYDDRAEWWTSDFVSWNGRGDIETITVDASCQNFNDDDLSELFASFEKLQTINNTKNLNTSQVKNMFRMFANCSSFTKLDISGWNTGEVTNMSYMFNGCMNLTKLNLSGWNTAKVTNTESMFEGCSSLAFIYVGTNWNTENVTNGDGMFVSCSKLPNYGYPADVTKAYVGDGGYLTSNMKTIYCKMEYGWWTADGAAIGIYTWDENGQKKADWPGERMTLADGETNIWKFDLDVAKYENCIFTRVNDSGDYRNAKTIDLTIPTNDDDMFTITNTTETLGDPGCEGTWSKYIAPKFLISGSMTNWDENMIKVYADSYTFESLYPGKYQFKVIDNGSRKGIDDMTEVAGGLYKDQDGNICFILDDVSDVTINYKSGELFTVDVEIEDRLVAPEMKLIGINGWNDPADAIVLTPAADKKSASVTTTLDKGWYNFKVIRADEWLCKVNGDDNYLIKNDWNWVDGLVRDFNEYNAISLQLDAQEVNKEFTFTYDYAAGKLTVTFPGANTITINDGNVDAANWEADPTEQYNGQTVTLKYEGKKKIKSIAIETAQSSEWTEDVITVYFTDAQSFGDVKVYYWPNGGGWPGSDMTEVGINDFNEKIYRAVVPANVEGIIFNGNGRQTVDITEDIADGSWWYTTNETDDSGHNKVNFVGTYIPIIKDGDNWTFTMPDYAVVAKIEYDTDLALNEVDDNTAVLAAWDGYEANVTLQRTLAANGWNTLTLPFNISSSDVAELNNILAAQSASIAFKELISSSFVDGKLTLTFKDAEEIKAGHPYMVKTSQDVDFTTLPAIIDAAIAAQSLPITNPFKDVVVSKALVPTETTAVDFIPTLGSTAIEVTDAKEILFMASGNTLKHPGSMPAYMKGFRAYFQLKGDAANAASFNLDFGNGETTGINSLTSEPSSNGEGTIYSLDGRRLSSKPVQKGVYIVNGKKMVIK